MRQPIGRVSIGKIDDKGSFYPMVVTHNQIQYKWALLAARAVGFGDPKAKINCMYLEFENMADPDDRATLPSFDRSEQGEYYRGLLGDRDFLRIPIRSQPAIDIAPGYEDYFDTGEGNRLTWQAQSTGDTGFLGLPFSSVNNSVIFGVALVSAPVWADQTQDIIFGRAYYESSKQEVKSAGRQIAVSWEQIFPIVE